MDQIWYSYQKDMLMLMPGTLWQMWSDFEVAKRNARDTGTIESVEREDDLSGRVITKSGDVLEYIGELNVEEPVEREQAYGPGEYK